MLDLLRKIAVWMSPLRPVALVGGLVCLAALSGIVFVYPASSTGNKYVMLAIIGLVWCLSAYGYIGTFQSVPGRVEPSSGLLARVKRRLARGWFWFLAILFGLSTLAALFLTFRFGSLWLAKYYG